MIEIRVTRPEKYSMIPPDLSAREGHYFRGKTQRDAIEQATIRFGSEVIDVQINHGRYLGAFKRIEIHGPDECFIQLPYTIPGVEQQDTKARLDYLRGEIEAERISYGEIAELQSLVDQIPEGDTLLLEWAGKEEGTC